jgi:ABC-type glutathione transport system ATPase component
MTDLEKGNIFGGKSIDEESLDSGRNDKINGNLMRDKTSNDPINFKNGNFTPAPKGGLHSPSKNSEDSKANVVEKSKYNVFGENEEGSDRTISDKSSKKPTPVAPFNKNRLTQENLDEEEDDDVENNDNEDSLGSENLEQNFPPHKNMVESDGFKRFEKLDTDKSSASTKIQNQTYTNNFANGGNLSQERDSNIDPRMIQPDMIQPSTIQQNMLQPSVSGEHVVDKNDSSDDEDRDPDELIKLVNVHKTYLMGLEGVQALRGINLDVKKGEFITVFGTSGGGKTTLLNIIGTIDKPTKGDLYL